MVGIVSEERVKEYGEVFTPDSIVNDMLDLVDKQYEKEDAVGYINKVYIEPSCGDGQFLIRILDRKIKAVNKLPESQREIGLLQAVSTIYGVDIQEDNVTDARKRMIELLKDGTVETFDCNGKVPREFTKLDMALNEQLIDVLEYIVSTNIQCGNTLENKNKLGEPLVLTEFKFTGRMVKATEYYLENLDVSNKEFEECDYTQLGKNMVCISDEFDF